ncbi:MAG TPA: hypothetical protein VHO43_03110 [Ignavibacteriales bacterium]|nr:hypothetical protein [Ignavibacteriales bacterium]
MELFWLFLIWVFLLYFIRIHMELYSYRKYFSQHNDIYVPSYNELAKTDHWGIRTAQYIFTQFRRTNKNVKEHLSTTESLAPVYKKKLLPMS